MSPVKYVMGAPVHIESDPPTRKQAHSESEITPYDEGIKRIIREEESKRRANDSRIERKIAGVKHGQWAVGTLVTLLGIYLTWLTTSQSDRNGEAGAKAAAAYLATEMPKYLKSTEDASRANAKAGAQEFYQELLRSQNPPPIGSDNRIAARPPTR
jgi:hypothetical protein